MGDNISMHQRIVKNPIWLIGIIAIAAGMFYWGFIATDRYVSQTNVVLQTAEIAPPSMNIASMLSGGAASNRGDLLLFREYLLSVDALKKLDKELALREHYANRKIDFLSRLSGVEVATEDFHEYFLSRVEVNLDDYAGVLRISASAFDKTTAANIVTLLLRYGELHMNKMGQRLAAEQVAFIEKQVEQLNQRLTDARSAILDYQNEKGLISPIDTAESLSRLVAELTTELTKLNAKESVLSQYQSASSPQMQQLNSEIIALEMEIARKNKQLTASQGAALNTITAEYETLKLRAKFAQELYSNALATLETTRVDAVRKLKQVSVLQEPTQPEYPVEPRRVYNIFVFSLMVFLVGVVLNLMHAIIKDHQD